MKSNYVPNIPLLREECYEIPSNGGRLPVEDFEGCYTFLTPNGTKVWCPKKGYDAKPTVGATYGSWNDVLRMYKNYAEFSGFSVRVGQTKKNKSDKVTHKYLRCNRAGRPQYKRKFDTLDESFMSVRSRSFQVTDCKAHISVQVIEATSTFVIYKFIECHNHPLVETYNRDFTKAGRKLSFSTKQFIHHMTLNNIGPTIAHRLQVSMKGGHHNVNGTPTDFKNFSQAIRLFIGNRDSQLLLDRLRDRVSSDLLNNTDFRSSIHRLVWNLFISPDTFETRWADLITRFQLDEHNWLSDMYAIRDQWVPAYFREIPMCCLMKTTSRCESSNASFKVNSSGANTLVQFILCYDTSIESQRYRQRLAEYKTTSRPYHSLSGLEIEKHAFEIYTRSIFLEIQKEIVKGKLFCYVSHTEQVQDKLVYFVSHLSKDNSVTNVFQVVTGPSIVNYDCSCRNFTRIGYLCRHIFCVFRVNRVVRIPDEYISKRWMKDVLPKRIFEIQYRYGVDNSPESLLRNEIFGLISNSVDSLRNDYDGLAVLANKVRDLCSNKSSDPVDSISKFSNVEDIQNLVGGSLDVDLECSNPQGIRNKGCGKSRRLIGPGEKAVEKSLRTPRLCRTCQKYVTGHDSRNCKKKRTEAVDVTQE
ncbi:hypothetical protein E3N88_33406 [Mikania micrantha]|uniref:SWIM-type domain-containing protein n=1 Tax=Mikania micrantha TaxID=192012 RepID=A0A5N6MB73_9ASTR|nr:hypothetical protein E3N88_33406 [Mikania micrantha]